jgi:archaellum component FlaC
VEIAKFIFAAVGTFLSVFGLSFSVFQYWKKKQEEKFAGLKNSVEDSVQSVKSSVQGEAQARIDALERLDKRIEFLERSVVHGFENRLSVIEGELRGIKPILQSIQNWFINNTPKGKG